MKNFNKAFSMLELVFVILVIGIIASLSIPRLDRDRTQEAADMLLSNIRYTQHMAMIDYRHDVNNATWQRSLWNISFESCSGSNIFVNIGADKDYSGGISKDESVKDPIDGLPMFWTNMTDCSKGGEGQASPNIFITKKFGVTKVTQSGGCTGKSISFDHLGRPYKSLSSVPNYSGYMKKKCTFTFEVDGADDFSIEITPETGYAYIVDQNAS